MIAWIYERSRYERSIEYGGPLAPPLDAAEAPWLEKSLSIAAGKAESVPVQAPRTGRRAVSCCPVGSERLGRRFSRWAQTTESQASTSPCKGLMLHQVVACHDGNVQWKRNDPRQDGPA